MVGHVFDLLHQRPEQEQLLLTQLVNKLGDPHRKVASKTIMFLLKLCELTVELGGGGGCLKLVVRFARSLVRCKFVKHVYVY